MDRKREIYKERRIRAGMENVKDNNVIEREKTGRY